MIGKWITAMKEILSLKSDSSIWNSEVTLKCYKEQQRKTVASSVSHELTYLWADFLFSFLTDTACRGGECTSPSTLWHIHHSVGSGHTTILWNLDRNCAVNFPSNTDLSVFPIYHLVYSYLKEMRSRDSVVGLATGYGLDDWEVGVRAPEG
jgi:hypothetical protein